MTPDNKAEKSQSKEGDQSSSDRKTSTVRRQEQVINCPRCNSTNTKFCYYNNYSLSQPRHYCKSCRRYWTKGGALRSVPIGGGCRKNKKINSSSKDYSSATSSSDIGGFNIFQGFSPAMGFPKLNSSTTNSIFNKNSSFGGISTSGSSPCFNLEHSAGSLMGFNLYLSKSLLKQGKVTGGVRGMGSVNDTGNLASSIESLSSINQDLHWKLQQQRLANMLFGGEDQKDSNVSSVPLGNIQKPQPILFQNLENFKPETAFGNNTSRKENSGSGNFATEWFFDNSFTSVNPTPTNSSNGNANENSNSWNDIQAWSNLNQYSTVLP